MHFSKAWLALRLSALFVATIAVYSNKYIGLYVSRMATARSAVENLPKRPQASRCETSVSIC